MILTVKDHISNTKLETGNHYYIQTRHEDLFSHYNLILKNVSLEQEFFTYINIYYYI